MASHYYINTMTMEKICYYLKVYEDEGSDEFFTKDNNLIGIVAQATEFE